MPRPKPSAFAGSADVNAMAERVAPAILALLAGGVSRTKATIIEALAGRHPADEVGPTLVRLAATEQVVETGGRYTLPEAA